MKNIISVTNNTGKNQIATLPELVVILRSDEIRKNKVYGISNDRLLVRRNLLVFLYLYGLKNNPETKKTKAYEKNIYTY